MDRDPSITRHANDWAGAIAHGLGLAFPAATGHFALGPDDCDVTPQTQHPAFWGCLDWHSSVHMQASAIALLDAGVLAPPRADDLTRHLNRRLTSAHVGVEVGYVAAHTGFERPYGWAWAAILAARAASSNQPDAAGWARALRPLADLVFTATIAWLPKLAYPVRSGVHDNTAFSLGLLHHAAEVLRRPDVVDAIRAFARTAYGADRDVPVSWEPSGSDFLSPALCEADLMRRVLGEGFGDWLSGFLPGLGTAEDPLLSVPRVLDRADGKAVHLFGLALSRAAMLRRLTPWLDAERAARVRSAADAQAAAAASEIVAGDFMSTHWLVSFALLGRLTSTPSANPFIDARQRRTTDQSADLGR